jgi:hypothetical protein
MKTRRLAPLLLALPLAAGCVFVSPRPRISSGAPPSDSSGYVGGLFSKDTFVGFGFVVRNEKTLEDHVLALEDKQIGLIALPPGRYRVASWVTWALTGEQLTKRDAPAALGRSFDVAAGQVVLLGRWSADRQMGFGINTYSIAAGEITEAEAVKAFRGAYPRFSEAPVRCLLCAP